MREYTHTHTHTDNLANKRKDKGITLIALVITTIILLILSGIVIIELTKENGLLDYIKISKEKHSISKAKEKLEIRIMQFKTEITDNQTLETFSDYLSKDVENGVYKIEKIYIDNKEVKTLNITDLEEYYTFEIDENFNINGPIESDTDIEATYEVVSSEETKNNIVVSIKYDGGIQKIICSNGKIIEGNNKTITFNDKGIALWGKKLTFKNTIIILTSNLGSEYILEGIQENGEISEEAKNKVEELLKRSFRPEFLNRLDEIVFYKPLKKAEISKILDLLIIDLEKRLEDKHIHLELTDSAKNYLIDNGYDEIYGARPLKRFVQKKLETLIAKKILTQEILPNSTVTVDCKNDELYLAK